MAQQVGAIPKTNLVPVDLVLSQFNAGTVTLVDDSRLPQAAAKESTNLMQVQDGLWSTRWGSANYGQALPGGATIQGAAEFVKSDNTTELVAVGSDGVFYRSTDGGTWTSVSGATFSAGKTPYFLQIKSYLYIANGTDNLTRYDGSTLTQYSSLSAPTGVNLARTTLTSGSYTQYYQVVAVNSVGFTPGSTEASITTNKPRDQWTSGEKITVSWSAVTGASRYDIYWADASGFEVYIDSTTNTSYDDTATADPNTFAEVPLDNTTTGPKFKQMELSGNRIWATGDPNNPWRVYWSGTGQYQGFFSTFYGGGYIDIEKGGRERPYAVVHYRSGTGSSLATVLTSDPSGNGSIWQVELTSQTLGSNTFIIPAATKIVGSVGSNAPLGVVKVRDDIMFINKKGVFSIGAKPQLLNVLSTDERTVNIRPFMQGLNGNYIGGSTAYFYDAKVFFSVPESSTTNNRVIVYDTERRNWAAKWTTGVSRFLEYTDSAGMTHFLAVPNSGGQLLQFSSSAVNDQGSAFNTQFTSGLIHFSPDKLAWAKILYAYIELSRPRGAVTFAVSGTEKKRGFSTQSSVTISTSAGNVGWSAFNWSTTKFSDTSVAPTTFAQASVKKRIRVGRLLNNIQFSVASNSVDTQYTVMTISAKGYIVPTADPVSWRSST